MTVCKYGRFIGTSHPCSNGFDRSRFTAQRPRALSSSNLPPVATTSGLTCISRSRDFPLQLLQSIVHLPDPVHFILTDGIALGLTLRDIVVELGVRWVVLFAEVLDLPGVVALVFCAPNKRVLQDHIIAGFLCVLSPRVSARKLSAAVVSLPTRELVT